MESPFTLAIDWLAFTVLASRPQEAMKLLGGDWSRAKEGFEASPLMDQHGRIARGRQTGNERASTSE